MSHRLNLSHNLVHVFRHLQQAHVQASVLLLMLIDEALEVLVHCVEECVDLF